MKRHLLGNFELPSGGELDVSIGQAASGDWDLFSSATGDLNIDEAQVPEIFRNSLKWASNALNEI